MDNDELRKAREEARKEVQEKKTELEASVSSTQTSSGDAKTSATDVSTGASKQEETPAAASEGGITKEELRRMRENNKAEAPTVPNPSTASDAARTPAPAPVAAASSEGGITKEELRKIREKSKAEIVAGAATATDTSSTPAPSPASSSAIEGGVTKEDLQKMREKNKTEDIGAVTRTAFVGGAAATASTSSAHATAATDREGGISQEKLHSMRDESRKSRSEEKESISEAEASSDLTGDDVKRKEDLRKMREAAVPAAGVAVATTSTATVASQSTQMSDDLKRKQDLQKMRERAGATTTTSVPAAESDEALSASEKKPMTAEERTELARRKLQATIRGNQSKSTAASGGAAAALTVRKNRATVSGAVPPPTSSGGGGLTAVKSRGPRASAPAATGRVPVGDQDVPERDREGNSAVSSLTVSTPIIVAAAGVTVAAAPRDQPAAVAEPFAPSTVMDSQVTNYGELVVATAVADEPSEPMPMVDMGPVAQAEQLAPRREYPWYIAWLVPPCIDPRNKRTYQVCSLVIVLIVVAYIILAVFLDDWIGDDNNKGGGGGGDSTTFQLFGSPINGTSADDAFGLSVSMTKIGSILAASGQGFIRTYLFDTSTNDWTQTGEIPSDSANFALAPGDARAIISQEGAGWTKILRVHRLDGDNVWVPAEPISGMPLSNTPVVVNDNVTLVAFFLDDMLSETSAPSEMSSAAPSPLNIATLPPEDVTASGGNISPVDAEMSDSSIPSIDVVTSDVTSNPNDAETSSNVFDGRRLRGSNQVVRSLQIEPSDALSDTPTMAPSPSMGPPTLFTGDVAVRVFQLNLDTAVWEPFDADIIAGVRSMTGSVQSLDMNSRGSVVAVGYRGSTDTETFIKAFRHTPSGWVPRGQVLFSTDFSINHIQVSLSDSGNIMATSGLEKNVVQVFRFASNNSWRPIGGKLEVNETLDGDFGASIALSPNGSRLMVGAPKANGGKGASYFYALNEDDNGNEFFVRRGEAIVGEEDSDAFGSSVAIDGIGNRISTSAPGVNRGAGSVKVWLPVESSG